MKEVWNFTREMAGLTVQIRGPSLRHNESPTQSFWRVRFANSRVISTVDAIESH